MPQLLSSTFAWFSIRLVLIATSLFAILQQALAMNTVGPPNIVWRNPKASGINRVWLMDGTNYLSSASLPSTGGDHESWKIAGTGDLNGDGCPDIVWQNLSTRVNAVWIMQPNSFYVASYTLLPIPGGTDPWRIVGVADFNRDGIADLLWQRADSNLNAVWLMNSNLTISYATLIQSTTIDWRIVGTGDINGDQVPDILLRHRTSGANAVWLMGGTDGLQFQVGQYLPPHIDQDYRIVASWDFNNDNQSDILLRHATLGLNAVWLLADWPGMAETNINLELGVYIRPNYDADWKIATQDMADSTWALQGKEESPIISATPSLSPLQVSLKFDMLNGNGTWTIQRKKTADSTWSTLVTGLPRLTTTTYIDTTVQIGERYEYKVFQDPSSISFFGNIVSSVNGNPIENRGQVILLVDQTLATQLTTSLDQLKSDLVGDGWTVVSHNVPRHVDDYSSSNAYTMLNYPNVCTIKGLVSSSYDPNAASSAVFIIGHVTIPYSGYDPIDGHDTNTTPLEPKPDHRGAWVADMYYGDLDGIWTDSRTDYVNRDFREPDNYRNDGKFDHDKIPEPGILKLAVGRVDFARLPVFTETPPPGIPVRSEVQLIQDYLSKTHRYRFKQLSWQSQPLDRAICYNHFFPPRKMDLENDAIQNTRNLLGEGKLIVGDFFFQRTRAYPIGYLAGSGYIDRINWDIYPMEHTSAQLADPANEPTAGFYMLTGSYFVDWNLGQDNFQRALLTTPNFGLAAMWIGTGNCFWRLDCLAIGEHLGMALYRRVNRIRNGWTVPIEDRMPELTIQGDPTLRLHTLLPPSGVVAGLSGSYVSLTWQPGEAGAQYLVYRSSSFTGPFVRVTADAVPGTSVTVIDDPQKRERVYMVRAVKLQSGGCGTYYNLSQGAFDLAE